MGEGTEKTDPLSSPAESRMPEARAPVLHLRGTHREIGRAHACEVAPLRQHLLSAIQSQSAELEEIPQAGQQLQALLDVWQSQAAPLVEMTEGLAEGLGLDFHTLLRYLAAPYLVELHDYRSAAPEECTAWAIEGRTAGGRGPMLCKNRDYRAWHVHLEVVALAEPEEGYRHGYVSSAGSPGVFSSGINERGLAVADTRVRTPDQGPGLPRYALMMEILEKHETVASALDYLRSVPHMGGGNLILADAAGGKAVLEITHSAQCGVDPLSGHDQFVVTTNHFVSPALAERWVDPSRPALRGNSLARRTEVESCLRSSEQPISIASMAALMGRHRGPLASICRHQWVEEDPLTVSGTIFLPAERAFLFCHGYPCRGTYLRFEVGPGQERQESVPVRIERKTWDAG